MSRRARLGEEKEAGKPARTARTLRAAAFVVLLVLAPAGADALSARLPNPALQETADGAQEAVSRELFDPEGKEDVRVSADGLVAGYLSDKPASEAYADAAEELEGNGWTRVSEGAGRTGSFAKDEGAYSLCFVSCVETAGKSAVVVQCTPAGEK